MDLDDSQFSIDLDIELEEDELLGSSSSAKIHQGNCSAGVAFAQSDGYTDELCLFEGTRQRARPKQVLIVLPGRLNLPPLQEGAHCIGCEVEFSFYKPRRHCLHCGGCFCASCVSRQIQIPKFGFIVRAVPVCDGCYIKVEGENRRVERSMRRQQRQMTQTDTSSRPCKSNPEKGGVGGGGERGLGISEAVNSLTLNDNSAKEESNSQPQADQLHCSVAKEAPTPASLSRLSRRGRLLAVLSGTSRAGPAHTHCKGCAKPFSFLFRSDWCRHCGFAFCRMCASHACSIPKFGYFIRKVPVCDPCRRFLYQTGQTKMTIAHKAINATDLRASSRGSGSTKGSRDRLQKYSDLNEEVEENDDCFQARGDGVKHSKSNKATHFVDDNDTDSDGSSDGGDSDSGSDSDSDSSNNSDDEDDSDSDATDTTDGRTKSKEEAAGSLGDKSGHSHGTNKVTSSPFSSIYSTPASRASSFSGTDAEKKDELTYGAGLENTFFDDAGGVDEMNLIHESLTA